MIQCHHIQRRHYTNLYIVTTPLPCLVEILMIIHSYVTDMTQNTLGRNFIIVTKHIEKENLISRAIYGKSCGPTPSFGPCLRSSCLNASRVYR